MEPLTKGVLLGAGGVLLAGVLLGVCCRGGPGYWGHRGDMYGSSAHARWGDHPQALVSGVSRQLGLDETQRARLEALAGLVQAQMGTLRPQALRSELGKLVQTAQLDQAGASALLNGRLEALGRNVPEVVQAAASFYDGLNEQQQQQLRSRLVEGGQP